MIFPVAALLFLIVVNNQLKFQYISDVCQGVLWLILDLSRFATVRDASGNWSNDPKKDSRMSGEELEPLPSGLRSYRR